MSRITPQVIRIRDFRSFSEELVVALADSPGTLGLITGINEAEPDLGANGTGKSTVWDALSWCLFGKTVRGLKGPAILPWGVDVATPRVQFTFEVEGHRYTISRTANPNGIRLFREAQGPGADTAGIDGEELDQASVERMIGMHYGLFLSTVVRGQFSESFLELTPKKKMAFLSTALDLDTWDVAAQRASAERKTVKADHAKALREVDRLSGAVVAMGNAAAASEADMHKEAERAASIDASRAESLAQFQQQAEEAQAEWEAAVATVEKWDTRADDKHNQIEELRKAAEDQLAEWQAAIAAVAGLEAQHRLLEDALEAAQGLGSTCPTCDSHLEEKQRDRAVARAAADLAACSAGTVPARTQQTIAETTYNDHIARGKAMTKVLSGLKEQLEEHRLSEKGWDHRRGFISNEISELSRPFDHNTHLAEAHARAKQSYDKATEAVDFATVASDKLESELTKLDFWVSGFQDIRLWMLRSALDELEALSNSHTLALGLRGWRILYEVERETKAGGIAKGFRCLIQSPTNPGPVPLESWSGGELQRLKIATQAAMCDLIRSRFGGGMALEVWDEPGTHLSTRGCTDMMAFFRERAATLGIEVWIVDHRSTTSGEFDQQLVVTRKRSGTIVRRGLR